MISMDFLTKKVAGNEFIDFQNENFFKELSACLKEHIRYDGDRPTLSEGCEEEVNKLVIRYTGFENITYKFSNDGNLYVDIGYFAPGHVLNNDGVDYLMKPTQSTLYRWFAENKSKVFKGSIDYRTGRVNGSFKTVPVILGINLNISDYFPMKKLESIDAKPEEALAGAIAHELGHVFSGCMMLSTVLEDNIVAKTALQFYRGAKSPEDRVVVLKDAATLLGMPHAKADELIEFAKNTGDESFLMYFTKMQVQRNNQRALSVGVAQMTSEVIADMYAIRMGCGKGILAAITTLVDRGALVVMGENFMAACAMAFVGMYGATLMSILIPSSVGIILWIGFITFVLTFILAYFSRGYSGTYNSDSRRLEDAVRQLIAKLKDNKGMNSKDKSSLIADITKHLETVKQLRPWYEGTVIYRGFGWLFSGSDFKRKEIEHFTQALNNNELVVLGEQLKGV